MVTFLLSTRVGIFVLSIELPASHVQSRMQIQKPSVMLPQAFGPVLLLADISGGAAFHSKSFFLVSKSIP